MTVTAASRRLHLVGIFLLLLAFGLYYQISDLKDFGYAVGVVAGIGVLALAYFKPRFGLIFLLLLAFIESTVNTINAIAEAATISKLTGVPPLVQTQWFAWGVQIIFLTLLLSYLCRESIHDRKMRPLSALEWTLLMPLFVVIFYIPITLVLGNEFADYMMDILPMCIYTGIVVLARVFYAENNTLSSRYYFLDCFIIYNYLILVPLWAYFLVTNPWRSGVVGLYAIRFGTGPYDFNFFLVPLLGMILTYDDNLSIGRRRFYQFAFFICLIRVIVSMFRGAIGGTLLAIVITIFLVDQARRWKWTRSLLVFILAVFLVGALVITTVPIARTTFNVGVVRRITQALNQGVGSGSLQFRNLETQHAIEQGRREWFTGYGPGSVITKNFSPGKFARHEMYLHSAYVWFFYKMGVIGLVVLLLFFIGIYGTCISLLRRTLHPPDRGWVIGTLAATIAMLPVIHVNNMLIRSQGAYALMLLLFGLSLIVWRYQGVPRDKLPPAEEVASQ